MIVINGSEGEGGGQVLRNACALSLVTGQPFTIENVRGKREKPGLMRQHVTALEAACAIGGAACEGLQVGSSRVVFRPGTVKAGEYRFSVGTAGSTGLVLQTVLIPLLRAGAPSRLVLEGGTHNMMAPPFEFIARTFLPIINRMGPTVTARLTRHGFYPRGGGRIEVDIEPATLQPVDCTTRGAQAGQSGEALFSALDSSIAQREIAAARTELKEWPQEAFAIRELPADQGPGTVLLLTAEFAHVTEVVAGFGRLGMSAEKLGHTAGKRMAGYIASNAFAGPYLQDQLLLPFAIAGGGVFTSVKLSEHTLTSARIISMFTGRTMNVSEGPSGCKVVEIR
jgi:RNA 3'-terminal phosphate cyclase (ATP)